RELDLKSLPYLTLPRPPVAPQNLIRARSLRPDMTVAKKTVPEAKKTRTSSASSVDASSCPDHSWSLRSCGRGFEEPQGVPPRAPPARSQTTIPSAPQTDVISLRPLMYFLSGLDTQGMAAYPAGRIVLQTHGFSRLGCLEGAGRERRSFRVRRSTWCIAKYKLAPPSTKWRQRVGSRKYHISIRGRSKISALGPARASRVPTEHK